MDGLGAVEGRWRLGIVALLLGLSIVFTGGRPAVSSAAVPTSDWAQKSPTNSPSIRAEFSMAYDAGTSEMLLFGGYNHGGFNDTWSYDGSTWTEQHPTNSPGAREYAAMAYDPAIGEMVLFGGYDEHGFSNATWTYDGSTWTEQHPATSPGTRLNASLAYDPATSEMVLFGGWAEPGFIRNETWTFDGSTWTQQQPTESPPARESASMAYDAATGEMILFGGFGTGNPPYLGDTWTFNGSTWTQQHPASSPGPRYSAPAAYDPRSGEVVLFGGYGEGSVRGDTWTFDGSTWSERQPTESPPARLRTALAYDPATEEMVLFGGQDASESGEPYLNDTWTYTKFNAAPSLSTTASGEVASGGETYAETSLAGGHGPGGWITFRLYGPDDGGCAGAPSYVSPPVAVSGNGSYRSGEFSPSTPGVYRWIASYSGDSNNEAVAGACGEAGAFVTVRAGPASLSPGFALTPSPGSSVATPDVKVVGVGHIVAVHGRTAIVPITCRSGASCSGAVDLQSGAYGTGGGVGFAHSRYRIAPGKTMRVAMTLGKICRQLLRHRRHARAYLYIHPHGGLPAGTPYVGGEIQLVLNRPDGHQGRERAQPTSSAR